MNRTWGYACFFTVLLLASAAFGQEEKYSYKSQNKRDPFIPLITPTGFLVNLEPEKDMSLNLEGIMFDPKGDSMAIINGELVRAGETVNGAVVASIEQDKVTVVRNNEKIDLELRREEK